jgi:hypothetical protein
VRALKSGAEVGGERRPGDRDSRPAAARSPTYRMRLTGSVHSADGGGPTSQRSIGLPRRCAIGCVLFPVRGDAAAAKEPRDDGAACRGASARQLVIAGRCDGARRLRERSCAAELASRRLDDRLRDLYAGAGTLSSVAAGFGLLECAGAGLPVIASDPACAKWASRATCRRTHWRQRRLRARSRRLAPRGAWAWSALRGKHRRVYRELL